MSEKLGPINYTSGSSEVFLGRDMGHGRDFSESTAAIIDAEVLSLVKEGYNKAEEILKKYMDKLHEVAKYLIKHEKMDGETFEKVMEGTFVDADAPEAE